MSLNIHIQNYRPCQPAQHAQADMVRKIFAFEQIFACKGTL